MEPAFEETPPDRTPVADAPVSDAMKAELDRRLAEHLAAPDDVLTWDAVKAQSSK